MNTFMSTMNPTPFGYYDSDPAFQADADKIVGFVLRKLGEGVLSVELTKKEIWACFEESTLAFNALMIEYQAKSNLTSLLGSPTGSFNSQTGFSNINLTNAYVRPTLEFLVRQAEPYAAEVGHGGTTNTFSGSIALEEGRQDYDIYSEMVNDENIPLSTLMPSGSAGRLKIHEVFHQPYVINAFNGFNGFSTAFAATGPGEAYPGYGNTSFYVLPVFEDVLRGSLIETTRKIRRSHYSYRLSGRSIRLFPPPNNLIPCQNDRLWIRFSYPMSAASELMLDGGTSVISGSSGLIQVPDGTIYGVSNPANVPYGLIDYRSLNPWARNWIFQFTLANSKELLGLIRGKLKNIPLPSGDLTLNADELLSQAREDKDKLMNGDTGLRAKLDSLTYEKLAEMNALKAENEMKQLQTLPMPPNWVLRMG